MKILENYQKGINLGGWISQSLDYSEDYYNTFITEKDIQSIAGMGFDHIRVPVDYQVIQTDDGAFIESGLKHIDDCISWAEKYSLHMILDLHKTAGYAFDEQENSSGFFTDIAYQDQFIELWKFLAKRYGHREDILAFEILNEIVDSSMAQKWNEIAKRCITEIRSIAPTIKILLGGVNYNSVNAIKLLDDPVDENIVYNFHCYEPMIFTHQNAYWVKGMIKDFHTSYPKTLEEYKEETTKIEAFQVSPLFDANAKEIGVPFFEQLFSEALAVAKERNVSLYCGEFGVIDQADPEDAAKWFEDILSVFHKHGIGYAIWNYKDKDFGLIDPHYASVKDKIIKAL